MRNPITRVSIAALVLAVCVGQAISVSPALAQARVVAPEPHERLLPLQGGRNFRDLGGYATVDGRHVKWGMLFRSGSMHGLTDSDYAYLARHGIRVVCDFRDTKERADEPVNWPQAGKPRVLSEDYKLDIAGFMPAGQPQDWTEAQARTAMAASYPRMLDTFRGQYRRMFAELLAGHAPLAFNCSAGKDRTGVAAALLLTALGVQRATVIQDYLLTNTYLDGPKLMAQSAQAGAASPLSGVPPQVAKAMLLADRSYIEAAFHVLDTHPGGARGWLHDEMGLSGTDITKLQRMYLSDHEYD